MTHATLPSPELSEPEVRFPEEMDYRRPKRRVLLVDDHPITRYGLRQLINKQLSLEVCGEADRAEVAVEMSRALQPDVAIVDISLPSLDGIELTKALRQCAPATAVLIYTFRDESLCADDAIRAGAHALVMKSEGPDKLLSALERVLGGDTFFSAKVKQRMLQVMAQRRRRRSDFAIDALSAREKEVLGLMGDGYTPLEIAERVGLSRKTIDSYREHLRRKLGIEDSNELMRYAIQRRRSPDLINDWSNATAAS